MPPPRIVQFAGTKHPMLFDTAGVVADHVEAILSRWPQSTPDFDAAPTAVMGDDARFTVVSNWLDEPMGGLTEVAAACAAIVDGAESWLAVHSDHLCLHCAAFAIGGKLVVLAGPRRMGKSTLAAQLAAMGHEIFTDDMLPLAPDGRGVALGIPARLRLPLPAGADASLVALAETGLAARDERYGYLNPVHAAPHGAMAPIGAIVLLDRRADGDAGFSRAGRADVLKNLILRNISRRIGGTEIAARLGAVMDGACCVRMHYADMGQAAEKLVQAFGNGPVRAEALCVDQPVAGEALAAVAQADDALPVLDIEQCYIRAAGFALRAEEDEGFLFDAGGASVLHLNGLARAMWGLLEDPITIAEASGLVAQAYPDADRAAVTRDTARLFAQMDAHGVIAPVSL